MNLVSVVTPVDGDVSGLARLVNSLIAQSFPYWEMLIVADDGGDYCEQLCGLGISDPRLRFFATQRHHSGLDVARDRGVFYARGNYLAMLEVGTVCYPDQLDRLLHMALQYGVCGNNLLLRDGKTGLLQGSVYPQGRGVRWMQLEAEALPLGFVVDRELIRRRVKPGSADSSNFDSARLMRPQRVPVLEQLMQEQQMPELQLA